MIRLMLTWVRHMIDYIYIYIYYFNVFLIFCNSWAITASG